MWSWAASRVNKLRKQSKTSGTFITHFWSIIFEHLFSQNKQFQPDHLWFCSAATRFSRNLEFKSKMMSEVSLMKGDIYFTQIQVCFAYDWRPTPQASCAGWKAACKQPSSPLAAALPPAAHNSAWNRISLPPFSSWGEKLNNVLFNPDCVTLHVFAFPSFSDLWWQNSRKPKGWNQTPHSAPSLLVGGLLQ